jgi:hypothetical protein
MVSVNESFADVASRMWLTIGAGDGIADWPATQLTTTGPRTVLPAAFDVTALATGAVAVATLAAARFLAARGQSKQSEVTVDSRESCAAFASERLFTPIGWTRPPLWDPIAGNYRAADAWIRLHTNYASHRAAVERVLGAHDRETVQAAVAGLHAEELETAIVEAGGCAAVMHNRGQWLASAPGMATADAPPMTVVERRSPGTGAPNAVGQLPFDGVRVLDLTRVIAGPVCTKFLAGYGADVLRIDPPGFDEVPSLLPETTLGKRTAALDLTASGDRATFEELLAGADVLVSGLRGDALKGLGYDDEAVTAMNPGLIIASLDAYGWDGPWRNRRGFDSLVQMSCGIADDGATAAGQAEPTPLPVQALDHATGWLLGAAVARALTRRLTHSMAARIQGSLIGTANLLYSLTPPSASPADPVPRNIALVDTTTVWGPAQRVPFPGRIDGVPTRWSQPAGPLGRHPAVWATP